MKYTFEPKTHSDALSFFMQVPFYGISDAFYKRPLVLTSDEVTLVEVSVNESPTYRMFYQARGFHGYVDIREKFSQDDFVNVEVKKVNKNIAMIIQEALKEGWDLTFYRYSPVMWIISITALVAFVYWLSAVHYHFINPEIVGNTMCDLKCVNSAWKKIMTMQMKLSSSIAGISALAYLVFFKAKTYKDARIFRSMQTTAFIIFAVLAFNFSSDLRKIFTPEFQTHIKMVYEPQSYKSTAERGIASMKEVGKVD